MSYTFETAKNVSVFKAFQSGTRQRSLFIKRLCDVCGKIA